MKQTFAQWFKENLWEYRADILNAGCDVGFPLITYTSDCVELYNQFEAEIYEALNADAEGLGLSSVDELTATFKRNDMLNDPDQRKNLLLWYMVEREAFKHG